MLLWLGDWLGWLGWYALVLGGWWGWWRAHQRATRLDRELTRMAHSLRYPDRSTGQADRPKA
jgi:hypothetical protein